MESLHSLMLYAIWFAVGFLAATFMFRRQFLKQKFVVTEYEKKLIGIIYSIHHDGFNPRLKRIRGLMNVCKLSMEKVESLQEFLERPGHQAYIRLVITEIKSIRDYFNKISSECLDMENDIIENAKKYR